VGILHGGVTSCLVDASAEAAGGVALGHAGRVAATTIRFLAPGRVGPVRAIPRVVAVGEQGALVEVRITDEGAGAGSSLRRQLWSPDSLEVVAHRGDLSPGDVGL